MELTKRNLSIIFACLAIIGRVSIFIDTPLWLDYFNNNSSSNASGGIHPSDATHTISASFLLFTQCIAQIVVYGTSLLVLKLCFPHRLTEYDRTYPKKYFAFMSISQGISSILFNYSVSGTRTAPYLQAVLSNFNIPIQFIVRFLVLRRRPNKLKLLCAIVVMIAEFICLIPKIFPSLGHENEGGAAGVGGVLWPMCMVASMIPFALSNSMIELTVQSERQGVHNTSSLNLAYFMFWWNSFQLLTVGALWWVDLIPGFGTAANSQVYAERLLFNVKCIFGQAGCGAKVVALAWGNYTCCIFAGICFVAVIRFSEGVNFVMVILTLRTPLLFLFWALFKEQPHVHWSPQADLSTWLSLGAIILMLPAIVLYDRAPPEHAGQSRIMSDLQGDTHGDIGDPEESNPLIPDTENTPINYGTQDISDVMDL